MCIAIPLITDTIVQSTVVVNNYPFDSKLPECPNSPCYDYILSTTNNDYVSKFE